MTRRNDPDSYTRRLSAAQALNVETGLRRAINSVHEAKLDAIGI